MPSATLFTTDYGQRIRANTYYTDIADASALKMKLKKTGSSTTAELTAAVVSGDTTNYAVYADIADGWLADKVGYWIGQVEATFANATLTGSVFTIKIKAPPTA